MSLFTKIDVASNDQTLPVLKRADVRFLSELEELSYDHWIFDKGSSDMLIGRVNETSLSPQTVDPVYNEKSITVSTLQGEALLSGLTDTEAAGLDGFTVFAVFKVPPAAGGNPRCLLGNYNSNGFMIDLNNYTAPTYGLNLRVSSAIQIEFQVEPGQWVGVFASFDISQGKALFFLNPLTNAEQVGYNDSHLINAEIGIGNPNYGSSPDTKVQYAESGIITSPYTMAELAILYEAAKQRMAARGITIT